MWLFFFLMILFVIYRNTDQVAGWSRGDAFILAATVFMMNSVSSALFMSLNEIPEHVRKGTLDFVVTKPIDSQFWVSTRKFNFDQIGTFVAGLAMVVLGTLDGGLHPSAVQWLAYFALVGVATIVFYSLLLSLMTTGIWLVRVDNLWILGELVMQVSRYPVGIFPRAIQWTLTYVFPLAFIATIPARQLVVGLDLGMLGLGAVWAIVFLTLSRLFWRFALRHYTSASS